MTTHRDLVDIRLDDHTSGNLLRIVPVIVTYLIECDSNYGADADGQRGIMKQDVYILDTEIDPAHLKMLTISQVIYARAKAIDTIAERPVSR